MIGCGPARPGEGFRLLRQPWNALRRRVAGRLEGRCLRSAAMRLARRSRSRHRYLRPCVLILLSSALRSQSFNRGIEPRTQITTKSGKVNEPKTMFSVSPVAKGTSLPCKSRLTSSLDSKKTPQRPAGNHPVPVTAGNFLLAHAKVDNFTLASTSESLGPVLPVVCLCNLRRIREPSARYFPGEIRS
jgi:hypothetical protein